MIRLSMTIERYIKTEYGNVSYILNGQFENTTVFREGANGKAQIFWIDHRIILTTKMQNGMATGTSYFYDLRGNNLKRILKDKTEREIMDLINFVQNRFKKKYENRVKRIHKKKETVSNKKKIKNLKIEQELAYKKVKDAVQEQIKIDLEETRNLNCPPFFCDKTSNFNFEKFKSLLNSDFMKQNPGYRDVIRVLIESLSQQAKNQSRETALNYYQDPAHAKPCCFTDKCGEMDEIRTQSGEKTDCSLKLDPISPAFQSVNKKVI